MTNAPTTSKGWALVLGASSGFGAATSRELARNGYDIFVKEKAILNNLIDAAHEQESVKSKDKGEKTEAARQYMCAKYFDVRTFGAVMSTGKNAGQVRGPVQLTFARSIDQVVPLEHSITRMAVATEAEAEKQQGDNRTMGRKFTIPYALYRCHGFVSAPLAAQTGFSDDDLQLFWQALQQMWDLDRSAARGMMACRGLYVFTHAGKLGNAPAQDLFERIAVALNPGVTAPRSGTEVVVAWEPASLPTQVHAFN
jgi:CRISPR-associated protein Csd2